ERRIDVAHIVEDDAADVRADEQEAELEIVEEQRVAAERKAAGRGGGSACDERRTDIARAGLIEGDGAKRIGAAAEESRGQRDGLRAESCGRGERRDHADLGLAREDQVAADLMIGGVAQEDASEAALRAEDARGKAEIGVVVDAALGIGCIVAFILREVYG